MSLDHPTPLDAYVASHTSKPSELLQKLYRKTYLTRLYPRMCCDPHQGRMLSMLTHMIKPRRVLELGTFSGYATLCFAEGLAEGGEIHTVEIDDEAAPALHETFEESEFSQQIHLHIGDAQTIVPKISDRPWDMAYIDANKRQYKDYYQLIKPLIAPGGFILADNTLWAEAVIDDSKQDAQTQALRKFNELVAADTDVEVVILPLYDGLTLIRLK